jgi:rhomboid protease GluP
MTTDAAEPRRSISPFHRLLYERTPRLIVTPAMIVTLVAIYGAMVVTSGEANFSTGTLMAWGGLFGPAVAAGEWWRLVTAIFLHAGPIHLALNSLVLWRLGEVVERVLAPPVFLVVYLLTGILASLASLQFHAVPRVSIGASGAIFGLAGALLAMVVAARGSLRATLVDRKVTSLGHGLAEEPTEPPPLPTAQDQLREMLGDLREGVFSFIAYNVIFGFMIPFVDNAAHLGGLAGGVAIGWLVGRRAFAERPRLAWTIVPAVVTVALAAALIAWMNRNTDVETEVTRHEAIDGRARDAFARALSDVGAGRQSAASAADALERAVLPPIRELKGRAGARLDGAQRRVADASKLDQYGRLVYWRQLPGLRYDLDRARAWSDYVTVYHASWQLRIRGLRDGDPGAIRQAQQYEDDAVRALNAALERPRPVEPI